MDMIPFDMDSTMQYGLLDPMSDPLVAMGKVQLALHGKIRVTGVTQDRLAVSLLRAARNLWAGDARLGNRKRNRNTETLSKKHYHKVPTQRNRHSRTQKMKKISLSMKKRRRI